MVTLNETTADLDRPPLLPLTALDALWFQVSGTLCNLRCNHCFISCSPENHTLGLMTYEQFKPYLDESLGYGVKEYYFTGGEPFINPDIFRILEATLAVGPATVLTNATRFNEEKIERLAAVAVTLPITRSNCASASMAFRQRRTIPFAVHGTFDQAMNGVRLLVAAGFLPIITSMRSWEMHEDDEFLRGVPRASGGDRLHAAADEITARAQDRAGSETRSRLRQI